MTASILDGKALATKLRNILKETIIQQAAMGQQTPELAVVLVGEDPASDIYVNHKHKACAEVGIISHVYRLPKETTEKALLELIDSLNAAPAISGILVQLPLPQPIQTNLIIERIHPQKDVDGFHPYNFGRLAQGNPLLRPCTPLGVMTLLEHYQCPIAGKHAVVIGASTIVGRPMALELLHAKATVTICHSKTQELEQHVRAADIVIVAAGVMDLVQPDWLHHQQIIIDIGMHRLQDGTVRGDVDFKIAKDLVAWITPVPFGVGPMTITTLLQNTMLAKQLQSLALLELP